jgi:hypothetical protein
MKLFSLNYRENKKPRKIGFTILGFFYNFLQVIWFWSKKKRKKAATVVGWFRPTRPRSLQKRARARARWRLCGKPSGFSLICKTFYRISKSHWHLTSRSLELRLFPKYVPHGEQRRAELRRARVQANLRKDWRSRVAVTELNPSRVFPLNQFHQWGIESTSPR